MGGGRGFRAAPRRGGRTARGEERTRRGFAWSEAKGVPPKRTNVATSGTTARRGGKPETAGGFGIDGKE